MKEFRWGILGTGFVARKFVLGLRNLEGAGAVVVASRRRVNAERFAADLRIPAVAASYASAVAAENVDAFYVASPPSEHEAQALLCIAAGRPVLVEKPFATDAPSAQKIVSAAREKSVFCMEAMWTRFIPLMRHVEAIVHAGHIGEPRIASGSFCAADTPDPSKSIFSKALGGGALLHRGIYPLSIACQLMGPPRRLFSQAVLGRTGVDEDTSVSLRHDRVGLSMLYCSLRAQAPSDFRVLGTHGMIHILPPLYRPFRMVMTHAPQGHTSDATKVWLEAFKEGHFLQSAQQRLGGLTMTIRRLLHRGRRRAITVPYYGNGYHYQADEVMKCVRAGKTESDVMPLADSLSAVEAMDEARRQWVEPGAAV